MSPARYRRRRATCANRDVVNAEMSREMVRRAGREKSLCLRVRFRSADVEEPRPAREAKATPTCHPRREHVALQGHRASRGNLVYQGTINEVDARVRPTGAASRRFLLKSQDAAVGSNVDTTVTGAVFHA